MNEIEDTLEEAGEAWRSGQRPPLEAAFVSDALATRRQAGARRFGLGASVAVAAVAAVALFAVWRPVGLSQVAGDASPAPGVGVVVHPGERVVARGTMVATPGEPVVLCRPLDSVPLVEPLGSSIRLACSQVEVRLFGIEAGTVPGAHTEGQTIVAPKLVVHGVWNGTGIDVESIGGSGPNGDPQPREIGCNTPADGAAAEEGSPLEIEAAYARLQTEIDADSATFAGLWVSAVGGERLTVVAAVSDPAAAATRIRGVFPYAFCVVQAEYSWSELEAAFAALNDYDPEIWPSANRVVVHLPVLDAATSARIGQHPSAFVQPLVGPDNP